MFLQEVWYILFMILIIGYAILDGFDLGVGVLHFFVHKEKDKRILLNAIGPVWDGNEVWLLTAGGALFAAFPIVYATVFSSFYLALYIVLLGLILRAVSMEFRSKVESSSWRNFWDWSFRLGSLIPALIFGVAVGNILKGIPLTAEGIFIGSFFGLLNPFALLVGLTGLAMFVLQGALYLSLKTEGELQQQMVSWAGKSWIAFILLYIVTTITATFIAPHLFEGTLFNPLFWVFFILFLFSLVLTPVWLKAEKFFKAMLASSVSIATLIGMAAVSLHPRIVPSSINLDFSLTIYNASSTQKTHLVMLVIALIGMPIVIGYTIFVYRQFKGKIVLSEESY